MPVIGFAAKWLLRVATGASIWGVYEFETNDIGESSCGLPVEPGGMLTTFYGPGLTELVRRLWTA